MFSWAPDDGEDYGFVSIWCNINITKCFLGLKIWEDKSYERLYSPYPTYNLPAADNTVILVLGKEESKCGCQIKKKMLL